MDALAEFFDHFLKFAAFLGQITFILLCLAPLLLAALCALIWFIIGPEPGPSRSARRPSGPPLLWLLVGLLLGNGFDDDCE